MNENSFEYQNQSNKDNKNEISGITEDALNFLVKTLIVVWNIFMRIIILLGVMPLFKKTPAFFFCLGFLLLALVMPLGVLFLASGLVGYNSENAEKNFIQTKNPLKKNDFKTDDEEKEALQGEAMLRVLEDGHSIEDAMKVHDAIGDLYDFKKDKGEIGGRNGAA